jgi:uncharacterized membrane protein
MKAVALVIGGVVLVLAFIILACVAVVVLNDPLAGKGNEAASINTALQNIGVENPTWQTVVVATSKEADVPRETVWEIWSDLENWPTWSQPLHVSTRWLGEAEWAEGAEFEQVLNLGAPLGTITAQEKVSAIVPGERVMWCKDENGVKSCHVWQFETLATGGTRITNVEVFHGPAMGLVKPLVVRNWQQMFEASVDGLIQQTPGQS